MYLSVFNPTSPHPLINVQSILGYFALMGNSCGAISWRGSDLTILRVFDLIALTKFTFLM